MVFQGTVLGPPLWNLFYSDACVATREADFIETVFADDLNCFKIFDASRGNQYILQQTRKCQDAVHSWGAANQIVFEPTKESTHILDGKNPFGDSFKILSVVFDTRLLMHEAVHQFAIEAGWRVRSLLRTKRFFQNSVLVKLFKCHILSFLGCARGDPN